MFALSLTMKHSPIYLCTVCIKFLTLHRLQHSLNSRYIMNLFFESRQNFRDCQFQLISIGLGDAENLVM